jgi:drug/metabolite transporter (DMT)-like permease
LGRFARQNPPSLSFVRRRSPQSPDLLVPLEALLVVLAAAVLHAGWNALAKGGTGDPLARSFMIALGAAATAVPALLIVGLPASASWTYVVASAVVHVGYFTIIGLAYRHADYSAVYPVIRGGAPLLTALVAAHLIGEKLQPLAMCGVALLCAGVVSLGFEAAGRGGLDRRSLAFAGLASVIVVSYTLIDGVGARKSGNSVAFLLSMIALTGVFVLPVALLVSGKTLMTSPRTAWSRAAIGGAMANLSYGAALWAMTVAPIGVVAAIRETSVLFATFLGAFVLKERFGVARWLSALMIVIGLALARTTG